MSSFVYQQGGSGGGGGASASIFVTGLTEDSYVSAETTAVRKIPNPESLVPNGYTQLTYIESTGTQYIDTGVTGRSGIKTELDFLITSSGLDDFIPMGCATADYANRIYPVASQSGKWSYGYDTWQFSNTSVKSNTRYAVTSDLSVGTQSIAVNGTTVKTSSDSSSVNLGLDMFLFALNLNGSAVFTGTICVYSCKIYENGVAVRNFVPAKRDSDGVDGLYDLVTQAFFENAGTGSFIAGEEIPRYFEEPYGVLLSGKWSERIVPNPESLVPNGYTQLTYIESTGTQYIDTGVTGGTNASFEMTARLVETNSKDNNQFFGTVSNFGSVNGTQEEFRFEKSNAGGYVWFTDSPTTKWTLRVDSTGNVYCDGVLKGTVSAVAGLGWGGDTYANQIFVAADDGLPYATSAELYSLKMFTDGVLSRNFIPAKRNSDNEIGLYDLVTQTFFGNSGTGTFIAGAEVPKEIDESGFLIAPIRNLGMWTVTATEDGQMAMQDVLVDVITEYTIEMSFPVNYLMLYDYGDEFVELTGGWVTGYRNSNGGNYGTWSKNSDNLYVYNKSTSNAGGSNYYINYHTVNNIDVSEYAAIGVLWDCRFSVADTGAHICQGTFSSATSGEVNFHLGRDYSQGDSGVLKVTSGGIGAFTGNIAVTARNTRVGIYMYALFLGKKDNWERLCSLADVSVPDSLATLLADSTSLTSIMQTPSAVRYMGAACTGAFMISAIASASFLTALNASPYKTMVTSNKHWAKFLAMVQ